MHAVTWLTISGAFVLGMVLTLLGSIKLTLARTLGISETRMGGLVSALHLALIPLMLLSGLLLDAVGPMPMLIAGCVIACLAMQVFTMQVSYRSAVAGVLLLGVGAACMSTATIVLMPVAFFGEGRPAASLNVGNAFFALGALLTPTLAELLLYGLGYKRALRVLGILTLLPVLIAPFAAIPTFPAEHANLLDVLGQPELLLVGLVFALYMPVEYFISTWSTTYLNDLGLREQRAAWLLSGFWLTFLAGRLLMAYLQIHNIFSGRAETLVIVALALGVAVALGSLAGAVNGQRAAFNLLALGFLLGPIFPTLVSIVFQSPELGSTRGTAYGAMFAIGSLGSLILAPVIGGYAKRTNVQHALRIPLVIAVLMMIAALVLALVSVR